MQRQILKEDISDLIKEFNSNIKLGLNKAQVLENLKKYGYNEIPEKKPNLIYKFLSKFWGITPGMLELVIILSWALSRKIDLYIVLSLLIINAIISFFEERLATKAIQSLKKKLYVNVKVLRDNNWAILPARLLVPGDIINIKDGDFVPADIKIIDGYLEIDESAITGESLTKEKEKNDAVYSGSIVTRGEAAAIVILTGIHTFYGKTVELVKAAKPKSHIDETIASLTKWMLALVLPALLISIFISINNGLNALEILPLMLVLLLSAIPVALPAMFTVSMAVGSRDLAKKNVLVTRLTAIEDAASINVLCVDKTGTLTMNKAIVAKVIALNNYAENDVILFGALASEQASLEPIDLGLLKSAKDKNLLSNTYKIKEFVPFDPNTKETEAVIEKSNETFRVLKISLPVLIKKFNLNPELSEQLSNYAKSFAQKGYRTIAIAKIEENKKEIVGLVALEDPARPEAKELISELEALGITVKLLTGDSLPIALEIASKVGLEPEEKVNIRVENKQDQGILKNNIFADIFPQDKYNIVKVLQKYGYIVGMTGDGVNDAPALAQAEVGIAVSNATDIAKSAASVVLIKSGLYNINELIITGRLVFKRVNTWIINKISRTILKIGFIIIIFIISKKYIITSGHMLLLIFTTDFIKITLATDNERISKKPGFSNIAKLAKKASFLGILMVIEAVSFFYLAIKFLNIKEEYYSTLSFAILFYFATFSIFVARENGPFWATKPSNIFLSAIILDAVFAFIMLYNGFLGFKPLPFIYILVIIFFSFLFSLIINDRLKLMFFRPKA